MSTRKILILLAALGIVTMWGVSIGCFGALPDRFPSHFDAAGVPDAYMHKSAGSWFSLPLIMSALIAFFLGFAWGLPKLSAKYATLVNVPNKAVFVALPEASRARALEPIRDLMIAMAVPLGLNSAYITFGTFQISTGAWSSLSPWPALAIVVFAVVALAWAVVRTKKSIEDEARATSTVVV